MKDTYEWVKECKYIAHVAYMQGEVKEMDYDLEVFVRYCEMQKATAERAGRTDSALYIQQCIEDMQSLISARKLV